MSVLCAEPLVGFRTWMRTEGGLRAVCSGLMWEREGPTEAQCGIYTLGGPRCESLAEHDCGLYAYYQPPRWANSMHVTGAIVAWGRIVEHESGFRAQYARPVALAEDGVHDDDPVGEIADRYDVPLLSFDELRQYADWFGEVKSLEGGEQ